MKFKRFKDIIIKNRRIEKSVKEILQFFYDRVQWNGDIPKIMKEISKELDVFIIQIPMNDSDFGAIFLNTGHRKYLLLNSNQPRNKMYFSFCHDIYHILNGTPEYINEKREVHFNQEYTCNDNENKANLFAANLLMPEVEFKKMYRLYRKDNADISLIVIKLMNYFNAPFVAVLIRLYELDILKETENIEDLLSYDDEVIEKLFDELWIEKGILEPSLKDEMPFVKDMLEKEGRDLIEKHLISEYNFKYIMENLEKLYYEIRLSDKK